MLSDDDSGVGSSPLKRTNLRKILSSDSESEPSPGSSNSRNKPLKSRITIEDSDSDSGHELEDHQTPRRSSNLGNPFNEKSNEDEIEKKELRRSERDKMSGEKKKRFKILERLTAKRAGKRLSDNKSSENEDNSDPSTPPPPPSPGCSNWRDQPPNSASDSGEELEDHQTPRSPPDDSESSSCEDLERTESDDEFIDDPEEGDNSNSVDQNSMDEIKKNLRKETPTDLKNTERYMSEHGKYQLEVHSLKNKSLYTSGKKRFKRHVRSAYFDVGMKDGSERSDPGLEFKLLKTQKKKGRKKRSNL